MNLEVLNFDLIFYFINIISKYLIIFQFVDNYEFVFLRIVAIQGFLPPKPYKYII